jgi:hypothetical protein
MENIFHTRFELENAPVAPGVWLTRHFAMQSKAKILHIVSQKKQEDDTYSKCRAQGSAPELDNSAGKPAPAL